MDYFIYILYSQKSDIFYVGHTSDVQRRFLEHNELSQSSFTAKHRPWEIKAVFLVKGNKADAMRIEKFIKKQKSKAFLKTIICAQTELTGNLAQLVRVPKFRD